jgi:hypothetical protein
MGRPNVAESRSGPAGVRTQLCWYRLNNSKWIGQTSTAVTVRVTSARRSQVGDERIALSRRMRSSNRTVRR